MFNWLLCYIYILGEGISKSKMPKNIWYGLKCLCTDSLVSMQFGKGGLMEGTIALTQTWNLVQESRGTSTCTGTRKLAEGDAASSTGDFYGMEWRGSFYANTKLEAQRRKAERLAWAVGLQLMIMYWSSKKGIFKTFAIAYSLCSMRNSLCRESACFLYIRYKTVAMNINVSIYL